MAELTEAVTSLIQTQRERDEKAESDRAHQEKRWQLMQHQFSQLQAQVRQCSREWQNERSRGQLDEHVSQTDITEEELEEPAGAHGSHFEPGTKRPSFRELKLQPIAPDDDNEHYLTTFERMVTVCCWPRKEWAIRLIPLLTGKARSASVSMDYDHTQDYEKVKEAILSKYEITYEIYRQRFRALDIQPGETPKELYVRLKDNFIKWIKPQQCSKTFLSSSSWSSF